MGSAPIGVENLVYAKMTSEGVYGTVTTIAPAIKIGLKVKTNTATLYGDNAAQETATAIGEISVDLETTNLPLAVQADMLGHTFDSALGVITHNCNDVAPYVAVGFKAKKANGKYRYVWLLKGRFEEVSEDYETTEDKPKFKSPKIGGTFVTRADGNYKFTADEEEGTVTSTFLSAVYSPTVDLTAPTYTSNPANAATGVSRTSSFTITFNKAMNVNTVSSATMFLVKDSDNSIVPLTYSWDTNKTVLTLAHASLAVSSVYNLVLTTGIKSKDSVSIASNAIISFTTSS
jgi:phi13 family phage major tail protein